MFYLMVQPMDLELMEGEYKKEVINMQEYDVQEILILINNHQHVKMNEIQMNLLNILKLKNIDLYNQFINYHISLLDYV